ncbi:MAG: TetR/AcrR family transcriptional regulator [Solirubrobacterales bacterium]|nr:TetR/AcrR family transcriptional regulator [Solirubrobacterales bacterium]
MKAKTTTGTGRRTSSGPAPDGRRANSSKKREREIVDAAAEIFHRQGYADTSVQDVADAVGILKGSLYYYIKSKEDLLFRVLEEVHEDAHGIIEEVAAMDAPPLERLFAYFRAHVEYNTRNLTKVAVNYHDFGLLSGERREKIIKERQVYERFVVGLIKEAQESGDVRPEVDARLAAYSALGMANWVYTWYKPSGKTSPDELADLIAEMIVGGLRAAGNGTSTKPSRKRS